MIIGTYSDDGQAPGRTPVVDLVLPDDAVTQTFAILGKRGSGKSSAAKVMAEEMHAAGHQWVAVDPKGDWHGLRSSVDGKQPGLPIPVFGGLHGDLDLSPTAGAVMAELIVTQGISCVLDVSGFDTKADQIRFLTDLGQGLYNHARRQLSPIHLFLEEADEFLPQMVDKDMGRCVGVWTRIIKLGRSFGLGATLITQRSASVNKGALTQVDTLVAMRTTAPTDRKVVKDWVHGQTDGVGLADHLPSLKPGEAIVWSPYYLGLQTRVQFRRPTTFDSGATPVAGQRRAVPVLADIDLGAIRAAVEATTEDQRANDPKTLKARIRELERQVASGAPAEPTEVIVEVPVAVVPPEHLEQLEIIRRNLGHTIEAVDQALAGAEDYGATAARPPAAPARPAASAPRRRLRPGPDAPTDWPEGLAKADRAVLAVLANADGNEALKKRVAALAGYSPSGGGFNNAISRLRTAGYVGQGDPLRLTDAGLAIIPSTVEPLPTGQALLDFWKAKLPEPEWRILSAAIAAGPDGIDRVALAAASGYAASGGGYNNLLSKLRTKELIGRGDPVIADATLLEAAGW